MENIMTYLGYTVVVIFVIYIITKMLSLNNKIIGTMLAPEREGFTRRTMTMVDVDDMLLKSLEKIRQEYVTVYLKDGTIEDLKEMVLVTEDIYHLAMIAKLTETSSGGIKHILSTKTLDYLSKIQRAKTSLKDLDEFLTHYKA